MNTKGFAILNSLVTYAVEHIPGGPSWEEAQVAREVGGWALVGARKSHDYKVINPTAYGSTVEYVCNLFADMGWRVVAVISDNRPGYADTLILERPVGVSHPND